MERDLSDVVNEAIATYLEMNQWLGAEIEKGLIANTPYLVIYRVKEETVQVIRVLHASRKYPE